MHSIGVAHDRVYGFFKNEYHSWLQKFAINYHFVDRKNKIIDEKIKTLITGSFENDELTYYPNLENIIVPFTGINQLDLHFLAEKGIRIFNTSAHSCFVAERALSLTLCVLGKIVFFHKGLEKGLWADRTSGAGGTGIKWSSLYNKKVAIYGYGSVGKELKNLLSPFKCKIGILNYKNRSFDEVDSFKTLEELASWSDVFIVCAPLNEATQGIINKAIFKKLNGSVLINVARGPIIEEDALFNSLNENALKGFASDVWYNYPTEEITNCKPSKYSLEFFDNVVMTPHNGGTEENADKVKYIDVAEQLVQISKDDYSRQVA